MKAELATLPECLEGPEAFQRFDEGMRQILSVPHSTLVRREKAYRKRSRRGPKRKVTPSASRDSAV